VNVPESAGDQPACSFCGAGTTQVGHLITGPGVWICDSCVTACYEIIQSLKQKKAPSTNAAVPMDDPIMATIAQVQQLALQGQREQAASAYEQLWPQVEHGRLLHRICLAHYMAELQDDPVEELRWDERALEAAAEITPQDTDAAAVAPLLASLHVNSARALHKLGRQEAARQQLAAARQAEQALPEDGYGRLVRSQIDALSAELNQQTLL
jgi:ClpX C4-type zinc finger